MLAAVAILCAIGLLSIYVIEKAISEGPTRAMGEQAPGYTIRQMLYLVAGALAMILTALTSYQKLGRWAYPIFVFMLAALTLLAVAGHLPVASFVPEIRGTRRWIRLPGFQVQPSEFMKIAFILALARYLRYRENYRTLRGLIGPFALTLVPMLLIVREPDLGTVILLLPVLFAMLFVAGARMKHLALIACTGIASMPLFYFFAIEEYQRDRIRVLLRQGDSDPRWRMDQGYQLFQSKVAIGSGGLTGQGFARGTFIRPGFLPDNHNDFIFAVISHQWGFLGSTLVLACFVVLVVAAIEVAAFTAEPFGRLLAIGVASLLAAQMLINVGMAIGLMPITGMTLPFVSFGGSSLITNFIAVGLLISIAKRRPWLLAPEPFEFGRRHEPA